jgi:hypothetical protein
MTPDNRAASSYKASDGAAYEKFLGRWSRRLAEALIDFARFPETGDLFGGGAGRCHQAEVGRS